MSEAADPRYSDYPDGFFDRIDSAPDSHFYAPTRLVTHIDDGAIAAVGELYVELGLTGPGSGTVLDLMSSWVSHFPVPPASLTVLGMNAYELEANPMADRRVIHDLNSDPTLPFLDAAFAAALCCVSVDYLVRPLEVFDAVARVVRAGGFFVCTFSNRCFPTKAIDGWMRTSDRGHTEIVADYFRRSVGWDPPTISRRPTSGFDPIYAVWARRKAH